METTALAVVPKDIKTIAKKKKIPVKRHRKRYTDDFKAKAIAPILAGKIGVKEQSIKIGVHTSQLHAWKRGKRPVLGRKGGFGLDKARGHALAAARKSFTPASFGNSASDRAARLHGLMGVLEAIDGLPNDEMSWVLRVAVAVRDIESEQG